MCRSGLILQSNKPIIWFCHQTPAVIFIRHYTLWELNVLRVCVNFKARFQQSILGVTVDKFSPSTAFLTAFFSLLILTFIPQPILLPTHHQLNQSPTGHFATWGNYHQINWTTHHGNSDEGNHHKRWHKQSESLINQPLGSGTATRKTKHTWVLTQADLGRLRRRLWDLWRQNTA